MFDAISTRLLSAPLGKLRPAGEIATLVLPEEVNEVLTLVQVVLSAD